MSELGKKILIKNLDKYINKEICAKHENEIVYGKLWRIKDGWVNIMTGTTNMCFMLASSSVSYFEPKPRFYSDTL